MIGLRQGKLGLVAVAVVALVAAGAAFAASRMHGSTSSTRGVFGPAFVGYGSATREFHGGGPGFGHRGGDELTAAATYLGISESDLQSQLASGKTLAQIANGTSGKSAAGLVDALVTAEKAELAQAVKDGRLTQAQADQIATGLTARMTALVNGDLAPHGPGFGMGPGPGDDFQAAADYLGISTTDLLTELRSGKTLAQVADATSGKSAAGLVDALVKHEQAELAQAVKDGKLTQSQADQLSTNLKDRVTALVNGTGGEHGGPWHHGFGPGPGDRGMPPSQPSQTTPSTHI